MPLYTYECRGCRRRFERRESMEQHEKARPSCPECNGREVERVLSPFFAQTSKKS
jgi:putative FmdB family regulatory protein